MSRSRKAWIITAVTAAAFTLLGATTAYAVATFKTGSYTSKQYVIDQTDAWNVPVAGSWQNVPSAAVTVTVPAGTSRLLTVRFNAESLCSGSGWCSVRVVYVTPGGAVVELAPQSGTDFAFDSAGGSWEAHAIERSSSGYLGAGNYTVHVQAQRVGGASTFRLDDYSTNVGLVNP